MGLLPFGTIRPTERGLVERLGKFYSYKEPGFTWLIPVVDTLIPVDITEQMVEVDGQEIITKDSLNAFVQAQIYFKVRPDQKSVMKSEYEVSNYLIQIVSLARTTLRAIIGTMSLTDANSKRNLINQQLAETLDVQTEKWGIELVRAELKEIKAPEDVQQTMNEVVKAEKKKQAAVDLATAMATEADGERQRQIKLAEGLKQSEILKAQGQATAIVTVAKANAEQTKVESEAASAYFKDGAVVLKRVQMTEAALQNNSKIIVPAGTDLVNVVGDLSGLPPIIRKKD